MSTLGLQAILVIDLPLDVFAKLGQILFVKSQSRAIIDGPDKLIISWQLGLVRCPVQVDPVQPGEPPLVLGGAGCKLSNVSPGGVVDVLGDFEPHVSLDLDSDHGGQHVLDGVGSFSGVFMAP